MKQHLRAVAVILLITALMGTFQIGWSMGATAAGPERPRFDSLTPSPFTTVATGPVLIGAHAYSDTALTEVRLLINGAELEQIGSQTDTFLAISEQRILPAGVYTATVTAVDSEGDAFQAQWDFVVSNNLADGEWFTASGQPVASQINSTMRSLVEAFRWHLYGLSWDGSAHAELPSHVGLTGTGEPLGSWVSGSTFDQADTEATLRSLVEAFRWHFWGISWDGVDHSDVPTHADVVLPPQGIDPWFTSGGQPIPANITATLRSLVEAFRWHFWGYSWDGEHHPDIPTHASMGRTTPTPLPYPAEGQVLSDSPLSGLPPLTSPTGIAGEPTAAGYKLTIPPFDGGGLFDRGTIYADASYSLSIRSLTAIDLTSGCLAFRVNQTSTIEEAYFYCLTYYEDDAPGVFAFFTSASSASATPIEEDLGTWRFSTPLPAFDWNTLKVIAKGDQLWFFINQTYLGEVTNDRLAGGSVGFVGYNFNYLDSETIEFKDLTIRALQPNGASMGEAGPPTASQSYQPHWMSPTMVNALKAAMP